MHRFPTFSFGLVEATAYIFSYYEKGQLAEKIP